ncbi:MAG: RluA family pseudouridine synthase [Clostridia bacterium]|nr:RluA family pseudouridine synthase [Clostridia bacterium]
MQEFKFTIEETASGERLDVFLAEHTGQTRSFIRKLLEKQAVLLNGEVPGKAGSRLSVGDIVSMTVPDPEPTDTEAEDIPLDIRYEDKDMAVINKQRGLVVHPAAGHRSGTLVNALLYSIEDLSGIGGEKRPGIVHRLDKDTTGLILIAKNDEAHLSLSEQIRVHTAGRIYFALLEGRLKTDEGVVRAPIGRSRKDRKKMAIVPEGREAETHYRVLERFRGYTLVECRLVTGRTHQIRVHMASLGHPVCGDPLYGFSSTKSPVLLLHAGELHVRQPSTGEEMVFRADLPDDFASFLSRLVPEV